MLNLSRRNFLGLLGGAGAAAMVAPTYFFAPVGGWKSDWIVNPADVVPVQRLSSWTVNVWSDPEMRKAVMGLNLRWIEDGAPIRVKRVELVDTRPRMKPRLYV